MSGICGILRLDGAPVDPEDFARMQSAMAFWGPERIQGLHTDAAAFTHFLAHDTPEHRHEAQPTLQQDVLFVAAARLDNRDELLRALGTPPADHATTADGELVRAAYARWGDACSDHLYGDWAFAAWNPRTRSFVLARDHFGNTSLYYHKNDRFLAFASSIKALLALPEVPRDIDPLRIAQVLVVWVGDGERTAYSGIQALASGHRLHCRDGHWQKQRYWSPEAIAPDHYLPEAAYYEQFMHLYTQAVQSRLRSDKPVGVTLSAGLDSGSVAALAAPLLAAAGKELTAYTSVPHFDATVGAGARLGHEWEGAHATALQAGVQHHVPVDAAGTSVLAGIHRLLEILNAPAFSPSNFYWITTLTGLAAQQGMGVLLTGQFGNGSVSYSGTGSLLTSFQRGGWTGLGRSIRYSEPTPWRTLKRQVLKPLLRWPPAYLRAHTAAAWTSRFATSAISPAFAQEIQLARQLQQQRDDYVAQVRVYPPAQTLFFSPGMSYGGSLWAEMGPAYGLSFRDPTADRRLVEFCLRVPEDMYRRRGEARWLLRHTFRDRLPAQVLHYKAKGLQGADIGHRMLADRVAIHEALDQCEAHPLASHWLDLPRVRGVLHALEREVTANSTRDAQIILARGLGVGLYLIASDGATDANPGGRRPDSEKP